MKRLRHDVDILSMNITHLVRAMHCIWRSLRSLAVIVRLPVVLSGHVDGIAHRRSLFTPLTSVLFLRVAHELLLLAIILRFST